jgi:hypothetical protein
MPIARNSLIHEATSLYRLVDSIDRLVAEHEGSFAYSAANQRFFSEIRNHAAATKKSVSRIVESASQTEEDSASRYEGELIIQKGHWKTLHTYVKPATEAHTLNLPMPLIELAEGHIRNIPGMGESSVVILLTPALMYYQVPESQLSPDLVFVEVPYSQGPGFFSNLTIYHEIGHHVFDRLAADDHPPFKALAEAQERAFAEKLGQLPSPKNRDWTRGVLDAWTKEVFCDLFALRHLGPAYSFALIDFLSLISLMGPETEVAFDPEHPAPALRFREQLRRLKEDGWWTTIRDLPSEHIRLLDRLASIQNYIFPLGDCQLPNAFTDAFEKVIDSIHALVISITPQCVTAAEDFRLRRADIENCLLHGVVPSQLIVEGQVLSPLPVSMINAAYCFYLTRIRDLMERFEDRNASVLKDRRDSIERLEAWTMKGIEDYQLYEKLQAGRKDTLREQ